MQLSTTTERSFLFARFCLMPLVAELLFYLHDIFTIDMYTENEMK